MFRASAHSPFCGVRELNFAHQNRIILEFKNLYNCNIFHFLSIYTSFYFIMSATVTQTKRQNPSDFLKQITGRSVVVKLNNGSDYRGILRCLDGYMNIVLESTEEYINGEFKRRYGEAFIRGNNVFYISTQKRKQ